MSRLNERAVELAPALLAGWRARFVNRAIPYAVQQPDGSYRWVYEPCEAAILAAHLRGELTVALSSTDARGWCKWVCLDVDAPQSMPPLLALRAALAECALPGLIEASRRGGHLWLFFDEALPAVAARSVVAEALGDVSAAGIEVPAHERYPDRSGPSHLGHAVRLPLGIHRKTGKRYALFDQDGLPCAFTTIARAAMFVLDAPVVSAAWVEARWKQRVAMSRATGHLTRSAAHRPVAPHLQTTSSHPTPIERQSVGTRSSVIRWVDAQISPVDLLAELAPDSEVRRVGHGYLGWCPFHDDRAPDSDGRPGAPSFYVVQDRCYGWSWRCLSTNCAFSTGPMKHSFRLLQELLELTTTATIHQARRRWPECAPTDLAEERSDRDAT